LDGRRRNEVVLEDTENLDEFVKLADYAMYKEKIKRRDMK